MEMSDNEQSDQKAQHIEIKKSSKKIIKKKSHTKSKVEVIESGPIDDEEALLNMGDDELEEQLRKLENETKAQAEKSVIQLNEEEVDAKLKSLEADQQQH